MPELATAPWDLGVSDADVEKPKAGFEPVSWDGKWRVSVTDPSQSGNRMLRPRIHPIEEGGAKQLGAMLQRLGPDAHGALQWI
ncbi:uncharacterized protein PG986_001950 [Apiospora aurea]|uniref:Uncharacterized protein n=1 Tax=Apiospora aurea TaxID=335848 RepID=A0ABR1QYD4_9PEZI